MDQANIVIEDRPVDKLNAPGVTGPRKGKYDDLFQSMEVGQCLRVEVKAVPNIQQALTKFLKRQNAFDTLRVVTRTKCDDGFGRVWVLPREEKSEEVQEEEEASTEE